MSRRPSVFVLALTVGDYLLWNWSLNGNHDVIALVSGLTLPPLALVSVWLLALGAARAVSTFARHRRERLSARRGHPGQRRHPSRADAPLTASEQQASRKLAA